LYLDNTYHTNYGSMLIGPSTQYVMIKTITKANNLLSNHKFVANRHGSNRFDKKREDDDKKKKVGRASFSFMCTNGRKFYCSGKPGHKSAFCRKNTSHKKNVYQEGTANSSTGSINSVRQRLHAIQPLYYSKARAARFLINHSDRLVGKHI